MKSWKEHAHLFANGKFKARYGGEIDNIIGINVYRNVTDFVLFDDGAQRIDECTLIARKIEDMTEDEQREYAEYSQIYLIKNVEALPFWQVLSLLEIGVYPFDQNHFETGEVEYIRSLS